MAMGLLDRTRVPGDEAFRSAAGAAGGLWEELHGRLTGTLGARPVLSWGGRSGWEIRYRRAGRPFVTVTPGEDSFSACVVLGAHDLAVAEATPMRPTARGHIDRARRLPDGTWIFLTVRSAADLADLDELLEIKLPDRLRRTLVASA